MPDTLVPADGAPPPANAVEDKPEDGRERLEPLGPNRRPLEPSPTVNTYEDRTPAAVSSPSARDRSAADDGRSSDPQAGSARTSGTPSFRPSLFLPKHRVLRAGAFGLVVLAILGGVAYGVAQIRAGADVDAMTAWVVEGQGKEFLKIRCDDCRDGTTVAWRGHSATVQDGFAFLDLGDEQLRLPVGEMPIDVVLTPPNEAPVETSVAAKVPFRVSTDLTPLSEQRPRVAVDVQAIPGAVVSVDGLNVLLNRQGRARAYIDAPTLVGPEANVEAFRRRIPYVVSIRNNGTRGVLTLREKITPLIVGAPGPSITVDGGNFTLSGKTAPNASVHVEGQKIDVGADGRFAHLMSISAPGQTTFSIRASAPEHLPRTVRVKVERVDDLQAAAQTRRADAVTSYGDLSKPTSIGQRVALTGTIEEKSVSEHHTRLRLRVKKGCDQRRCRVQVAYGALAPRLNVGDRVEVFGERLAPTEGTPDKIRVGADFILPRPR